MILVISVGLDRILSHDLDRATLTSTRRYVEDILFFSSIPAKRHFLLLSGEKRSSFTCTELSRICRFHVQACKKNLSTLSHTHILNMVNIYTLRNIKPSTHIYNRTKSPTLATLITHKHHQQ